MQMEVESFYKAQGKEEPSSIDRFKNIIGAAKDNPKCFAQALGMLHSSSANVVGKQIFGSGDIVRPPAGCTLSLSLL